jgi:predicted transcriptional regulator of viral defense system
MNTSINIKSIFEKGNGYAKSMDLRNAGVGYYEINKLLAENSISQVKRGLYLWNAYPKSSTDYPEIAQIVPNGVLCLHSACHFHGLGDYMPYEHHVALERHRKIRLPTFPPINLYFWSEQNIISGAIEIQTPNGIFKITDLEKTVCDMVKYRNKVGKDLLAQALRDYMKHPNRNLNLLISYARVVRVEKTLTNYLETLL